MAIEWSSDRPYNIGNLPETSHGHKKKKLEYTPPKTCTLRAPVQCTRVLQAAVIYGEVPWKVQSVVEQRATASFLGGRWTAYVTNVNLCMT